MNSSTVNPAQLSGASGSLDGSRALVFELALTQSFQLNVANIVPGRTIRLIVTTDASGPHAIIVSGQALVYAGDTSGIYPQGPSKVTVFEFTGSLTGEAYVSNLTSGDALEFFPDCIICNGQSNAAAGSPGTVGYSAMTALLGSDIQGWSDLSGGFVSMVDGAANMRAATGGVNPGPGGGQVLTRIARRVADATGGIVKTFAAAYTSQGIAYFLPNSATNAFYTNGAQASVNNYTLVKNAVIASGRSPKLIIWIQGEANEGETQAAYFASLSTLIDNWIIDYPEAKILIYLTIGSSGVGGIQAAQRQAAATYPNVMLVDNSDLDGKSAYYAWPHYESYAGYQLAADRGWSVMQGNSVFPAVPDASSILSLAAWEKGFQYNTTVSFTGGRNQVLAWNDDVVGGGANQLLPGANNAPTLTPSNGITTRPSVDLNRANSECVSRAITQDGGDWTFFFVTRNLISIAGPAGLFMTMYDGAERLGLITIGQSIRWQVFELGTSIPTSGPLCDTDWHDHMVVINSSGTASRWYTDGILAATGVLAGTQTLTNPIFYFGSNIGVASFQSGETGGLWFKTGIPASISDEETLASSLHQSARIEFPNIR